jgi:hypothetical protein
MQKLLVIAAIVAFVAADVYMHNPPGSNNRVDDNNNAPANRLFDSQNNNEAGYNTGDGEMTKFYAGSKLMMMWTAQHACGTNPATHCEAIIQYRCDTLMRDGTSRNQPEDNLDTATSEPSEDRGRHEPYANWLDCKTRDRNKGLFTADQNVGNQARATRQNAGGGRSGYECAEERDYFPYWHPTVWKDIAVMTDNVTRCQYYKDNSFNVRAYGLCSTVTDGDPISCAQNDGTWTDTPAFGIPAPDCVLAPWSRANVHGTAATPNAEGELVNELEQAHYNMSIPNEVSSACVVRLRYNISTMDYDGWTTDSASNGKASPVETNPDVEVAPGVTLQVNINTAQFGRTFEDRTHVFQILALPEGMTADDTIYNMNVRGKRGNNAATYPNTEYDYVPARFHMQKAQYVHWQWTGTENNNNGNDRNNVVQIQDQGVNMPMKVADMTMWGGNAEIGTKAASSCGSTDPNLQDVGAYCDVGLVQMNTPGMYEFMSTKNNAYSNRDQKGAIVVEEHGLSTGAIVGIVAGSVAVVGGAAGAAVVYKKRKAGTSAGRF